ncbi:MAG: serine O-acetyltransferase [Phycisphaerae bacterium]
MNSRDLGEELPRLVERLVAGYLDEPRTQHLDRAYLPARPAILEICEHLLELTYPGYVGRTGLTRHNVSFHVGELLPRLWDTLVQQIALCLCHDKQSAGVPVDQEPCRRDAAELTRRFIESIPAVREMLALDVQAAYDGDPAATGTDEVILAYPGILAITIHRYAHELYRADVPLIPRVLSEYAHRRTGIDIHPGARIGRSFFIDHGTGVVIGETSEIGNNVKIYQGVTLGALSFPTDERGRLVRGAKRHPTIGNNVTIYANAIVLGGETLIGDGAVIGGSVFITKSVAPGHQVAINPPLLRVKPPRVEGTGIEALSWDI